MNHRGVLCSGCVLLLTVAAVVVSWNDLRGQQKQVSDDSHRDQKDPGARAEETARQESQLAEMKSVVNSLDVFESQGDQRRSLAVVEKPLLHFRDEVRRHLDGTFWVWGRQGRPVATGEVWSNRPDSHVWYVAMVSTTVNLTGCEVDQQPHWTPKTAGVSFVTLPSEARPATNSNLIQTQMRSLARRFSAVNTELRLLARPVHRYQDRKNGILAGALFVFAHETNPEISLLIEAVEQDPEPGWQYALARSSSGALEVQLDRKTVWSTPAVESVVGLRDEPFRIIEVKADVDRRPGKSVEKNTGD